ncbi:class I adenylate-forming enzyme family protein [Niveispirillum sp.]|uniref:class I adenylate-forming enzyme family protein n=1 Tax=Niveispirillum sp. TaxID=1917217 RepID=UPI001B3D89C6|nr:AMP-binding protein [Niveispirillum sp.]MBP7335286.1 AMP-binding protein [Niveispirillum sp.]
MTRTWPALSIKEAEAVLCRPGSRFEIETAVINGREQRVWARLPANLADLANEVRARHGGREFLVFDEERVTYDGWYRAVAALADHFVRSGVGAGDRVAIAMRNLPEWPVILFAAAAAGAIAVPLNAWWTGEELGYALDQSGARFLVCDVERLERISNRRPDITDRLTVIVARSASDHPSLESIIGVPSGYGDLPNRPLPAIAIAPDDPATIFYTSGTTGRPKGALGTHRNLLAGLRAADFIAQRGALRRGEPAAEPQPSATLLTIPLFHVTGCASLLMSAFASGGKVVMMHKWEPVEAMRLIERERIATTGGVPTIAWQLLDHPARGDYDLTSLEYVPYGGAPAAPDLPVLIQRELKAVPYNGWGMTETSGTVTGHAAEDYLRRPESCGPPLPVADLRITDEAGQDVPVGEIGELRVRGPQVVQGYWRDPEATAATFGDGWLRTGDLARLDEEGFCVIVGRSKDVIIRGGENIYAVEVENALFSHPAVTDAAVVALPHDRLGEEPGAMVQIVDGHDVEPQELILWLRERLAGYKIPVLLRFHDGPLPRNANGKIMKNEVRRLLLQGVAVA